MPRENPVFPMSVTENAWILWLEITTHTHICHKQICLVPDYNITWAFVPKGGWNCIRNYLNICISMKTLVLLWTWITKGKGILLFLFYLPGLVLDKGPRATGKSLPGLLHNASQAGWLTQPTWALAVWTTGSFWELWKTVCPRPLPLILWVCLWSLTFFGFCPFTQISAFLS